MKRIVSYTRVSTDEQARACFGDLFVQVLHSIADFAERFEQRLQSIGSQVQFFNQAHGFVTPADEPPPSATTSFCGLTLADCDREVFAILGKQMSQCF